MGNEVSKIDDEIFETRDSRSPSSDEIVEITKQDLINASNESIRCDTPDTTTSKGSKESTSVTSGCLSSDKENTTTTSTKVRLRMAKSKSSTFAGDVKKFRRSENKRASFYQKLKGYNDLAEELQKMKAEFELAQQEKVKLREKMSNELKRHEELESVHEERVNGLLSEFKKCKIENDKLKTEVQLQNNKIQEFKILFHEEKQNIADIIERKPDYLILLIIHRFLRESRTGRD